MPSYTTIIPHALWTVEDHMFHNGSDVPVEYGMAMGLLQREIKRQGMQPHQVHSAAVPFRRYPPTEGWADVSVMPKVSKAVIMDSV